MAPGDSSSPTPGTWPRQSSSWRATPTAAGSRRRRAPRCGGASSRPRSGSGSRPCTDRRYRSSAGRVMRRWLWWSIQIAVAGVVAVLVWRAIAHNWDEFRSLHVALALKPGWIALATLVVFAAYAMQIESWRRVLAGWAQRLPYSRAARIWLLVNLGRYVPGKLWSVAGRMVFVQGAGGAAGGAGASAFAIQAVALGTARSEEHTSELQSHSDLVCRLLLEKKNKKK